MSLGHSHNDGETESDVDIRKEGGMNMEEMSMSFHAGFNERILWDSWETETVLTFVLSCIGILVLAVIYEALKFVREKYKLGISKKEVELMGNKSCPEICCSRIGLIYEEKPVWQCIFNKVHLLQTLMHVLQLLISYILMLIVMTYNYWLFLSVIIGSGIGYFAFGCIRERLNDYSDHCH